MGGMLAMRYALMYPREMTGLVVVNPIGLEDWKAKGVPFVPVDQLYERELKTSFESIKRYQQSTYYGGEWKPEYDRWVNMLAGMYAGDGGKLVAWNQALTSDMVLSQPVIYEMDQIAVPTVLMIGQKDTTAIGKDRAPSEVAKTLGNYPELGGWRMSELRARCSSHSWNSATPRRCRTPLDSTTRLSSNLPGCSPQSSVHPSFWPLSASSICSPPGAFAPSLKAERLDRGHFHALRALN